jgi:5-methylcytosine-specific restriction endonuclease McrA
MPSRIPCHRPLRLLSSRPQRDDSARPNAAARGYCSKAHKRWRQAVLTRDAWQCQSCGVICSQKGQAHADHASPVMLGTDKCMDGRSRYDVAAGQTLCHGCHSRKTHRDAR